VWADGGSQSVFCICLGTAVVVGFLFKVGLVFSGNKRDFCFSLSLFSFFKNVLSGLTVISMGVLEVGQRSAGIDVILGE